MSSQLKLRRWIVITLVLVIMLIGVSACQFAPTAPPQPTALPPTTVPTTTPVEATAVPPTTTEEPPATESSPTKEPSPTATEPAEGAITQETVHSIEELRSVDVSPSVLLSAEFAPVGHRVATYGFDKVVRIYDADDGTLKYSLTGHGDYGYAAVWSPDGTRLASGGDYTLRIWDTNNGDQLSLTNVRSFGFRLAWSPSGDRVAIAGDPSSHLEVVNADGGIAKDITASSNRLWAVGFSPTGLLAASDNRNHVYIYDADSYETVKELMTIAPSWDLEFSPDGSLLAACDDGGQVEIWRTDDWSSTLSIKAYGIDCTDGAFSSDGSLYFTVGDEPKLIAWNPATGSQLASIHLNKFPWWVSVSGDDQLIALALDDGTMRVWGLP